MPNNDSVSEGTIRDFKRLTQIIGKTDPMGYDRLTQDERTELFNLFLVITGRLVVLAEMEAQFRNEASNPR